MHPTAIRSRQATYLVNNSMALTIAEEQSPTPGRNLEQAEEGLEEVWSQPHAGVCAGRLTWRCSAGQSSNKRRSGL